MDSKHDRHERIVKLSRDCTIQSKRVIFLLHRIGSDANKTKVLAEADQKIHDVLVLFRGIALELEEGDPYLHHSAYLPGVQEFIEALSYLEYLKTRTLLSLDRAQHYLVFSRSEVPTPTLVAEAQQEKGDKNKEEGGEGETARESGHAEPAAKEVVLPLNPVDYVQGIADLTGELMRLSINAVGGGNRDLPFQILPFVQAVHCGMLSLPPINQVSRKLSVLRASLAKIEQTCYTLKIRGSEIPKHMLVHAINTTTQAGYVEEDDVYGRADD